MTLSIDEARDFDYFLKQVANFAALFKAEKHQRDSVYRFQPLYGYTIPFWDKIRAQLKNSANSKALDTFLASEATSVHKHTFFSGDMSISQVAINGAKVLSIRSRNSMLRSFSMFCQNV